MHELNRPALPQPEDPFERSAVNVGAESADTPLMISESRSNQYGLMGILVSPKHKVSFSFLGFSAASTSFRLSATCP
jgi:hypothetical protein